MGAMERRGVGSRGSQLAQLLRLAQTALGAVSVALFEGDVEVSSALTGVAKALKEVESGVEDHAFDLLSARDRASGIDVRVVVSEVHINANVGAMVDLVRQVADIAGSGPSRPAMPAHLRVIVREMSRVCLGMLAQVVDAVETGSVPAMAKLHAGNAEVGSLQWRLLTECGDADLSAAIDVTLVGRLYEMCAGHTVALAHQARLLAEAPQGR